MPNYTIDYSKGIIYTIMSLTNPSLLYVGSTTDFVKRKHSHKSKCITSQIKLYVMIRANGGWKNFVMNEYSNFPCNNSQESKKEEERVRLCLQANLNTIRAYLTEEQAKERYKEYYIEHRVEKVEYNKEYYKKNQIKIAEKKKEKDIMNKKRPYNSLTQEQKDKKNETRRLWRANRKLAGLPAS